MTRSIALLTVACASVISLIDGKCLLGDPESAPEKWQELTKREGQATAEPLAPGNPWEKLADMPGKLGRFELASDGRCIYRLGGISFNISSGTEYDRGFAVYDLVAQVWEELPQAPFGTGGAMLAYWPEKECLVAVAGIGTLSDDFDVDGVTVGVYRPQEKNWTTKRIACDALGRPAWLAHVGGGQFLVLTADPFLYAGKHVAPLNLNEEALRVVGDCPAAGRMTGVARIGDTLFVLMSRGKPGCELHRFDVPSGRHSGSVGVDDELSWVDKLFSWNEGLYVWKNSGPYDQNQYRHASALMRIDPATGQCVSLHSDFPGPQARRSSSGIVCGDGFYAFGGQRTDSEWLCDTFRYRLAGKDDWEERAGLEERK